MGTLTKRRPFVQPRALLLFPPIYDFALYDLFLKPYSLCRLGSWLEACGYQVRLVNGLDYTDPDSLRLLGRPHREGRGTGKFFRQVAPKPAVLAGIRRNYARYGMLRESLEREIRREEPDVVLVSSGMTYWYPGVVEAVRLTKQAFPWAPVILGGIYATLCPEHARRVTEADFIVSGEAFPHMADILGRLGLPRTPADGAEGKPEKPGLFLPAEANWECGVIRLNRGCPLRCRYCASPVLEPRFRPGDPQEGFFQMTQMYRRFGTRSFCFYDDALLMNKESILIPFLEKVISSGLEISFYVPNAVHVRYLDRTVAGLMRRSGFREVCLGLESAQAEFHSSMDRKLYPRLLPEGLQILYSAGFSGRQITGYILAGLPGQRREEVEESIRLIASLGIRVEVTEYSPVPQSPLWETAVRLSRFPLAEEPLTHNNTLLPMRWEGLGLEDLQELKDLARSLSGPACR